MINLSNQPRKKVNFSNSLLQNKIFATSKLVEREEAYIFRDKSNFMENLSKETSLKVLEIL